MSEASKTAKDEGGSAAGAAPFEKGRTPPTATHTPGPWEAVLNDDPRGQPSPMYRSTICTVEHSGERCLTVVQQDGLTSSRWQWVANARLIAAAPDLLEVVKRGRQKLATYTSIYTGDKELRGLLAAWDAAIKRATES
jgi:hypothetical protein